MIPGMIKAFSATSTSPLSCRQKRPSWTRRTACPASPHVRRKDCDGGHKLPLRPV